MYVNLLINYIDFNIIDKVSKEENAIIDSIKEDIYTYMLIIKEKYDDRNIVDNVDMVYSSNQNNIYVDINNSAYFYITENKNMNYYTVELEEYEHIDEETALYYKNILVEFIKKAKGHISYFITTVHNIEKRYK